jgi:outer membrane protein assembly factor BamB
MRALVTLAALVSATAGFAADWPQWRGPNRDGVSRETGLLQNWPAGGPALLWKTNVAGRGFGSFAVVGDRIYLLGALGADVIEHVIALDSAGKQLWATPIAKAYDFRGNVWSLGPNSTPSVDGHFLYALGSQGVFVCVDDAGKEVWRVDLVKDLHGHVNPITGEGQGWGFNWSPLVIGDRVIIAPGGDDGLLAALDKTTGKVVWRSKDVADECTYSSPVLADIGGVPQIVYAAQTKVYGVAVADGRALWSYEKKRQAEEIVAATPIVKDGMILVSGAAAGSEVLKITKSGSTFAASTVWSGKQFANLHGGMLLIGDHVYGADEKRAWKCFDFASGKESWETRRPGVGSVVAADGLLYCVSQDGGTVSLVEANPTAFRLKGQFTLPEQSKLRRPNAGLWTHPVIADGKLYVRDQELVFCYRVGN